MTTTLNASTAGAGGFIATSDNSGVLALQTAGTTAITVDTSQNVGIGTSSPSTYGKLTVNDTAAKSVYVRSSSTNFSGFLLENTNSATKWQIGVEGGAFNTAGLLSIGIDGVGSKMAIDSSGNLIVGDTTTGSRLKVKSTGTTNSTVSFQVFDSGGTNEFYIQDGGNINTGLKASSPYNQTTGSAANMFVDSNGNLNRSTSSLKYKTDVNDALHGLADVLKLRSVTYKGKNDGDIIFGGFIAEEVDAAGLNEFVQYAADGSPDALNYGNMVALCVKAIQELKTINDTQAETLTQQTEAINALTARITALEN